MLISTKGIVFNAVKFQESSLIVKMLTEEKGLQSFLVKGVRTPKAKGKAAFFQPGMVLDVVMYYQENKNLKSLREYRPSFIYQYVFTDIAKSSILIFLMEVISQCVHDDDYDLPLFTFLENGLRSLDTPEIRPNHHLYFMSDFMKYLGIYPHGQQSQTLPYFSIKDGVFISFYSENGFTIKESESHLFSRFLQGTLEKINRIERKILLGILLQYYAYHIENFKGSKSLKILETILT